MEIQSWPESRRLLLGEALRARVCAEHSADRRAAELEAHLLEAGADRFAASFSRSA